MDFRYRDMFVMVLNVWNSLKSCKNLDDFVE